MNPGFEMAKKFLRLIIRGPAVRELRSPNTRTPNT